MAENTVINYPLANLSNPSITHSCARIIIIRLFVFRNYYTRSGPNFTIFPVPAGSRITFAWIPNSLSESVGSDQRISTTNYYSNVETINNIIILYKTNLHELLLVVLASSLFLLCNSNLIQCHHVNIKFYLQLLLLMATIQKVY